MSGIRLGGQLKLMTLTTSEEAWERGLNIRSSFRALMMRMKRRGFTCGYFKVMEYTKRGRPHLHVIVRGPWFAQSWLSQTWAEIHLSPIVDVRRVKGAMGVAGYLAKYLGKDLSSRYSWSWDWVWRGFTKTWRRIIVWRLKCGDDWPAIIDKWNEILDNHAKRKRLAAQ